MQAAIIGVGTELTTGQIHNTNASWISKQLQQMGFLTSTHLTVPDNRQSILEALSFVAKRCQMIFVTGGLGPTSDDFTRELIAEWTQKPLLFDNDSWLFVQQTLQARGVVAKDMQKQQCFFPEGAKILVNSAGTAHGFYMNHLQLHIFVLPGPPKEVAAIWQNHILNWLQEQQKNIDPMITLSWDTLGLPESEIAQKVMQHLAKTHFEIGYRVHLPYVEVKLSFHESQKKQAQQEVAILDSVLSPYTVLREGQDIVDLFLAACSSWQSFEFCDTVTGAILLKRLLSRDSFTTLFQSKAYHWHSSNPLDTSGSDILLSIKSLGFNSYQSAVHIKGQPEAVYEESFQTPILSPIMEERRKLYCAEMALLIWTKVLQSNKIN